MTWFCRRCGFLSGKFPNPETFELISDCFSCRGVEVGYQKRHMLARWHLKVRINAIKCLASLSDNPKFSDVVNQLQYLVAQRDVETSDTAKIRLYLQNKTTSETPRSIKIRAKQ